MAKKMTNQELHRISVKRKIVAAANNMFAETGDINMRDLASQMGVTTGTLYHYYKDKEDIIHELNGLADAQTDFEQIKDVQGSVMRLWYIFTEVMVNRVLDDGVKFTKVRVTSSIKRTELNKGIAASKIRNNIVSAYDEGCFRGEFSADVIYDFLMSIFRYCAYQYGVCDETPNLKEIMQQRMFIAFSGILSEKGLAEFTPDYVLPEVSVY